MILVLTPPLYHNSAYVINHPILFSFLIHNTTRELNLMFIVQNNQSFRSYRFLYSSVSPTQTVILSPLALNTRTWGKLFHIFPKYFESSGVQPSSLTVDILLEKVEKLQGSDKKLHLLSLLRKIRSWKLFRTQFWIKDLILKLPFYNTRKQAHDKKTKLSKQYNATSEFFFEMSRI